MKAEISYAEMERRSRLDLAARTYADPTAHADHVVAARRVLETESLSTEVRARELVARLTTEEKRTLRDLTRAVIERERTERATGR